MRGSPSWLVLVFSPKPQVWIILAAVLLFATTMRAEDSLGPWTLSGNFVTDLLGEPDDRVNTWGTAGHAEHPLRFRPPAGHRVRILEIEGDWTGWATLLGAKPAVMPWGRFMGALGAIHTGDGPPSGRNDYPMQNHDQHLWYRQEVLHVLRPGFSIGFQIDLDGIENNVLGPEHTLWFKHAVWLNDSGMYLHSEITFSRIVYEFIAE